MKQILIVPLLLMISGCFPYPMRVVMPLKAQVVDGLTGAPIAGAHVLRIVCDVHDFQCKNGVIAQGETDSDGYIKMSGKRQWGIWFPAPGAIPAPNHQIAIWKGGYQAFVFSQYGKIDDLKRFSKREDIIKAMDQLPKERNEYSPNDQTQNSFSDGKVKLHPASSSR